MPADSMDITVFEQLGFCLMKKRRYADARRAFEAACQKRFHFNLEREFCLRVPEKALLLGFAVLLDFGLGVWFEVHDKLNFGNPRVVLRHALRRTLSGATGVPCSSTRFART